MADQTFVQILNQPALKNQNLPQYKLQNKSSKSAFMMSQFTQSKFKSV